MKIYTGTGDQGQTSLFSGERVGKDHPRVATYGEVDELNSVVGALAAALPAGCRAEGETLQAIQADLFRVGACLATAPGPEPMESFADLPDERVRWLEKAIDRLDAGLPPLRQFILPAGHPAAGWSHLARTVARRAERRLTGLWRAEGTNPGAAGYPHVRVYLNRLSDYFFVLARAINRAEGVPETPWSP
jgi:cob(I)alamin adenosyltransferase